MPVINIFNHEFTTIASLKSFAAEHGFSPIGNKTLKSTWVEAVTFYLSSKVAIVEISVKAEQVSAESSEAIEVAVLSIGSLVIAALTSEQAIGFYRGVLKFLVFVIVVTAMFAMAAVKWCWANRDRTAVYHWIKDASRSAIGETVGAIGLVPVALVQYGVAMSIGLRDGLMAEVRAIGSDGLMRLGLGGVAIEVQ